MSHAQGISKSIEVLNDLEMLESVLVCEQGHGRSLVPLMFGNSMALEFGQIGVTSLVASHCAATSISGLTCHPKSKELFRQMLLGKEKINVAGDFKASRAASKSLEMMRKSLRICK